MPSTVRCKQHSTLPHTFFARIGGQALLSLLLLLSSFNSVAMDSARKLMGSDENSAEASAAAGSTTTVVMETSAGTIELALDAASAPKSVANFLDYVDEGYYDGTVFHRVIDGFMIQGGGFTEDMLQKPTRAPVPNEADNGLQNLTGTIAMARTNAPHSATSQFFINVADNAFLNHRNKTAAGWGYTVFGKVTEGMDVVNAIKTVATGTQRGHANVPLEAVVIKRVYRKP